MRPEEEGDDIYARLIAINKEAFAGKHFETAYHALAAALHWAKDSNAMQLLIEVEQIANQQLTWIDRHAPTHSLSSQSARTRGNESVFRSLAQQSAVQALMVHLKSETEDKE